MGLPACPEQSEHQKVFRLLDAPSMRLSAGFALEPQQSTVALIVHHPQAIYFAMRSGRLQDRRMPDEVIAGSRRDPRLYLADGEVEEDPTETVEA